MGISLKGVNLGYMGLDKSLLVEKPELQNVPYQCPAIAYIIEHPDGRILWETGVSARAKEEWLVRVAGPRRPQSGAAGGVPGASPEGARASARRTSAGS